MINIVKRGEELDRIDIYNCDFCGTIFEVDFDERVRLNKDDIAPHWCPCPLCGMKVFSVTSRKATDDDVAI